MISWKIIINHLFCYKNINNNKYCSFLFCFVMKCTYGSYCIFLLIKFCFGLLQNNNFKKILFNNNVCLWCLWKLIKKKSLVKLSPTFSS